MMSRSRTPRPERSTRPEQVRARHDEVRSATPATPEATVDPHEVFLDTLASGLIELALSACLHPEPEP